MSLVAENRLRTQYGLPQILISFDMSQNATPIEHATEDTDGGCLDEVGVPECECVRPFQSAVALRRPPSNEASVVEEA